MFSVIMTDWSRCLWYKSENKATFSSQNCNTWLISVEIWASLGLSVVLMKFTKILHAKCRHRGSFKARLTFHWERKPLGLEDKARGCFCWISLLQGRGRRVVKRGSLTPPRPRRLSGPEAEHSWLVCRFQPSWGRMALHTAQWVTAQTGVWEFSPGYSKANPPSHLISKAGAQTMGFHKPKRKDLELSLITQATSKQQSLRLWFQKPIKWNV